MERFRSATLDTGIEFAGYRVEGRLGRGGMGVVYRAHDLALGRTVALKVLAPELAEDELFRKRFHREARLAASIDHPNVVPIFQAGEAQGLLYIAMRYVEGTDLASLLRVEGALEPPRALTLTAQVAAALDAAHEHGLIHRDVKPSNILIAGEGKREHCYLADFGLTKLEESRATLTRSGQLLGTPGYLAPEQIVEGVAGPASDVYALGCVVFECLTGEVPYARGSEFAVLWAHVHDPPPKASARRPELPSELDALFATALAKNPSERYRNGVALVEAARAAFPPEELARTHPSRPRLAVIALVVAVVAVTAWMLSTRDEGGSSTEPTLAPAGAALQRIDPRTNELVATIPIGGRPADVAVGTGAAWVIDSVEGTVLRIDAATNRVRRAASGVGDPAAVAVGRSLEFGPGVFIAGDGPEGVAVAVIDPKRITPIDEDTVRSAKISPAGLLVRPVSAVAGLAVTEHARRVTGWIADAGAGLVWRGNPGRTRPSVHAVKTGGVPMAVAVPDLGVWVAQADEVVRIHERGGSESPVASARVPGMPIALASAQNGVWIANYEDGAVSLVDPQGEIVKRARVGGHPIDLAVGNGALWVLRRDGVLARVDSDSGRIASRIPVGPNPSALAVGEAGVWVAVWGGRPLELSRLPRQYVEVRGRVEGIEPGRPGEHCAMASAGRDCVVIVSHAFVARDGTRASRRSTLRYMKAKGGSIDCLGRTYDGPVTSDVREDPGFARFEIEGWGTIALRIERLVAAFSGMDFRQGPICTEQVGTWVGTTGPLRGATGTYAVSASKTQPIRLTLK